ncbi:hypothetical protein [Aureliella helgolandensis]|uniref:Uncharacterized protein n=1 Tax=Aureliella helgolandensis TaxID=2527968 RepID=A0A518G3G4_9BACT|nr:hypothetical protein [Aureliella helgolandensis]QDV23100.1 hypothetical protein Q31a_13950 [Aureliella helgolandensis]
MTDNSTGANCSRLVGLCVVFIIVSLLGDSAIADDELTLMDCLSDRVNVSFEDYAFDGGSIVFKLNVEDGPVFFLAAVHPKSAARAKLNVQSKDLFLLSQSKHLSKAQLIKPGSASAQLLAKKIANGEPGEGTLSATLSKVLLSTHSIIAWGDEARIISTSEDTRALIGKRSKVSDEMTKVREDKDARSH